MADDTRLTESTLWRENEFAHGHRSVWGSLYDPQSKRWGYACCKGVSRTATCTASGADSSAADAKNPDDDSGIEQTSPDSDDLAEDQPWDFRDLPPTFKSIEDIGQPALYLEHFVHFFIGEWTRQQEQGLPGFGDMEKIAFSASALEETKKALGPLLWRLKKGDPLDRGEAKSTKRSRETRTSMEGKFVKEKNVLQQLTLMATSAYEREYLKAHGCYMQLTFGNKMWNLTHVAHVAACTMKGAREYRRNRDSLNTYDMDPVSQKYMHAFKKLCHLSQCIRPNQDESKNFKL